MLHISKLLTPWSNYLIAVGIMLHVVVVAVILGVGLYYGQTPPELFTELSLKLDQSDRPVAQRVRRVKGLLGLGPILDQTRSQSSHAQKPNPLLSAANPDNRFPYQVYDENGRPRKLSSGFFDPPSSARIVHVTDPGAVKQAIRNAQPGDIINLAPGHYSFSGRSIPMNRPGTRNAPIYIRADRLGSVTLAMNTWEGFHVKAPFWVFENLIITGDCANAGHCEHAFHIIGKGSSFVLRNSRVQDFNASIKVNGGQVDGSYVWPDYGLIEYSAFYNNTPRDTASPVTLLNIDSVNYWTVRGNFIADFSKLRGNRVSYGAFMKGNGHSGIFERNVVVCEHNLPADKGIRIGLSFGGGGTGAKFCRNQNCATEHTGGIIRNNVIINCSRDVGIYLNRSAATRVYNNLLHNSLGIDVRFATASAVISDNLISGRIKEREGGSARTSNNYIDGKCLGYDRRNCSFDELFADPDNADLRLKKVDNPIWSKGTPHQALVDDLCGKPRGLSVDLGPIQYTNGLDCLQAQNPDTR